MTTISEQSPDEPRRDEAPDTTTVPGGVQDLGYDAQTDLALPDPAHGDPDAVITPYAGSVVEEPPAAAYDMDKDIAL